MLSTRKVHTWISQPMTSPDPGGGTGKLPMTEPARERCSLCRRGTAARPMRGCEPRGWKAGRRAQHPREHRTPACCPRRRPPWPAPLASSPRWPRSSPPPLPAETPGPVKSVREGRGGVLSWGGLRGKRVLSRQQPGGGWGRQLGDGGVPGRGAGWGGGEGLRLGAEGDRSRQGAAAEGGMGMCRGYLGWKGAWAGLASDLTEKFRNSEHLPWTRLFVKCPR